MKNYSLVLVFIFSFFTQIVHANFCSHHQPHNEISKSHDHSEDHGHESSEEFQTNTDEENAQHSNDHCRFHCCSNHVVLLTQNARFQNVIQPHRYANRNESKLIHFHSSLYRPPIV